MRRRQAGGVWSVHLLPVLLTPLPHRHFHFLPLALGRQPQQGLNPLAWIIFEKCMR